ncbi:MAG: amino acid adenylation domain-containing protein [Cyanobacteria bacterium P01_A01_bin.17]
MQSQTLSGFQLSTQQRQLWSLQREQADYNQILVLLKGNLDIGKLRHALETAVERHESLRTTFRQPATLTMPLQMVEPQAPVGWQHVDENITLEQAIADIRQQPHILEQLPAIKAVLGGQAEEHWLLLTVPALCADHHSLHLLVTELAQHYGGQRLIDPEELVQYSEFATWQQSLENDEEASAGQDFWQQRVELPSLSAPLSQRHRSSDNRAEVCEIPLSKSVQEQLSSSQNAGVILLASWLVMLWRQTEQPDFTIGVIPQHRSDPELESGIGAFQQPLPFLGCLSESIPFATFVQQVQQEWEQLEEWQDYFPGVEHKKACSVGFEYQTILPLSAGDLAFEINRIWGSCDSPLHLTCAAQGNTFKAALYYSSGWLSEVAIKIFASQWQAVLIHALKNPNQALGNIPLTLNQDELPSPIKSSAATQLLKCFHQQFAQQTLQTPHQTAVVYEQQQLTYQALEQQANQLAHALQHCGAGPDIPVALYLERSVDAVVAILAILKSGSAYLPLDPALPTAGLAFRLQDAKVPVIITQTELLPNLPSDSPPIFCLDAEQERLQQYPIKPPQSQTTPENLAYLIYTSGSTGQPKPVAVEHRQLMTYVYGIIERLQLPPSASYASVSTLAADLGHTMLFPSLCQGGTLHLLATERVCDSQAFADYSQQHQIDCLKIVPSHLQALLKGPNPCGILPQQRLILGGEVCRWSLIESIMALQPHCQIFNHYGPTETTVGVMTDAVTTESIAETISATVPLGIPLDGVQVYVLDAHQKPVPIGVPGEVYVGGQTVGRGYLNRPQLTTERFMTLSVGINSAEERLYKTGDRARLLPDGSYEFLGRIDQQVKLHGFRIELGEIEAVLAQHETVKEVVVMVREDQPDNLVLVAYVVTNTETVMDTAALRQYLQTQLPDYMIPSLFVALKILPLTTNGKVNRRALPIPEKVRPELSQNFVAPRTETEVAIATIWCDILQLEIVGVTDNFFDLGGHSLLATQVLSRLRETFQIELPLRRLFDAHTVAEIADVIEEILTAEIEALSDDEAEEQLNAS